MTDIGDLGRFGEMSFKSWCAASGLVVNGSLEQDATGWDCKVEYKHLHENTLSNPLRPENSLSHPLFDVQIKTTGKDANKWDVKLEHLVRFAQSPHPAFLCIIQADLSIPTIKQIHLIHIDKRHIPDILKKHRKLHKDGKGLQHKTMRISGTQQDIIVKDFAQELKKRFEGIISDGMQSYTSKKTNILEKSGYDGYENTIHFKASPEELNQHFLGLNTKIDVTDFCIIDNRFGVPLENKAGIATLEASPEGIHASLIVTCNSTPKLSLPVIIRKSIFDMENFATLPYATITHEAFKIIFIKGEIKFVPEQDAEKDMSINNALIFTEVRFGIYLQCNFSVFANLSSFHLPLEYHNNPEVLENGVSWKGQSWALKQIMEVDASISKVNIPQMEEQTPVFNVLQLLGQRKKKR
jgi:hypothetical protein